MGEERLEPVGRNAAFGRLAADVHLQQHILHDAERDGAARDRVHQLRRIDRVDQLHRADEVFHLVFLQMPYEMDAAGGVGVHSIFGKKLLHAVFRADVHTGADRLLHGLRAVHLRCGEKAHLAAGAAGALGGGVDLLPGHAHIFGDAHIFLSSRNVLKRKKGTLLLRWRAVRRGEKQHAHAAAQHR